MPETAAPAPVVSEPTKIPPPTAAGPNGAAALSEGAINNAPVADDPFEFELDVKGQKQKLKFSGKDQLTAVLQKALYADQVIKDASQAKKGAETLMQKLKTPAGVREVLSDPDINLDVKQFALGIVQEMMNDEKLTPEQREARDAIKERDELRAEKQQREEAEKTRAQQEKLQQDAAEARTQIIAAMQKYPDIPQTQATMDAVIQNMRAAYKRFGKHLTPEQAMTVYSQQYWNSFFSTFDKMSDDQIRVRFGEKNGQKVIDKIQQLKLNELKKRTDPATKASVASSPEKKKKHLTEKEFEKHFQQLAGL